MLKWYQWIYKCFAYIFNYLTPLEKEMKIIEGNQNKSIQSFFRFFRGQIQAIIFQIVLFAPFFYFNLDLDHILENKEEYLH